MSAALQLHRNYQRDPKRWGKALAGKTGAKPRWRFAEKTPAAKKYGRLKSNDFSERGCVHCHEVQRVMIDFFHLGGSSAGTPDRGSAEAASGGLVGPTHKGL